MWHALRQRLRTALRYKLLALVLVPLLAAMAVTLGYTLYWFHDYTRESLNLTLRDRLAVARQALRQLQHEHQLALQQLAEADQLHALMRRGDVAAIQRILQRLRDANGLAFLHLTSITGNWLFENAESSSKPSPLTDRAARGLSGAALEVFRPEDLLRESASLPDPAHMNSASPEAKRALLLRLVQPIPDEQGRVSAILDAGLLLNHNHLAAYTLHQRTFTAASLPSGADPLIAVLLDGVRIAAAGDDWRGLIGSHADAVPAALDANQDMVVVREALRDGAIHVSAYGALYDVDARRIGSLQVTVREAPFRAAYLRSAALLLALFLGATAIAAWLAVHGVRKILEPIETMAAVVRATQAGENRRIGPIGTHDEIGELARQFDTMLDQLAARNREIQRAADALEVKVRERTRELEQKNAELHAAIELLQKTKEQLAMADKLSALGRMAAGIAHEINNPAAVILGNLDVLSAELGPAAAPVAREIELIGEQVERIRHIVNSLLQFARARPGVGPLADVDVNQLVHDVAPLVAHALNAKAIVLVPLLRARTRVRVNMFDLEQVLINLIVNAANACERGGRIEVVTDDWDGNGVVVRVRDNGCGIPPDRLKHIFDPFFTTDPARGAGLGLSVSYGLVRRYGGEITVESRVGEGSAFSVWLRAQPEIAEAHRTVNPNTEAHYG
ncbi:MAG TPA: ATP-binding protein [Burkholderiales bacterium]